MFSELLCSASGTVDFVVWQDNNKNRYDNTKLDQEIF